MSNANGYTLEPRESHKIAGLGNILGIFGFIPSLVMFLLYGARSTFVKDNMRSALNFQLTMVLVDIIGAITLLTGVGFLIVLAAWFLRLVLSILAFVKTSEGEDYVYPLTISFIK